jgi:hypothetical protein
MNKKEKDFYEKHNGYDDANDDDARLEVWRSLLCDANVLILYKQQFFKTA